MPFTDSFFRCFLFVCLLFGFVLFLSLIFLLFPMLHCYFQAESESGYRFHFLCLPCIKAGPSASPVSHFSKPLTSYIPDHWLFADWVSPVPEPATSVSGHSWKKQRRRGFSFPGSTPARQGVIFCGGASDSIGKRLLVTFRAFHML